MRRKLCRFAVRLSAVGRALLPALSSQSTFYSASNPLQNALNLLEAAAVLAQLTSMARSDALQFCCNCVTLPLSTAQTFLGSGQRMGAAFETFDAAQMVSAGLENLMMRSQMAGMAALFRIAIKHDILDAFADRLDPVQLATWLAAAGNAFQVQQAMRPKGDPG